MSNPTEQSATGSKAKMQGILSILIGLAVLAGAVYIYFDIVALETTGGERSMPRILWFVYELTGVWGVSGLIGLGGLYFIYHGINMIRKGSAQA